MTLSFGLAFKLIIGAFAVIGAIGTVLAAVIVAFFVLLMRP